MSQRKPAFERSSGNVFKDLGFARPEAELAKAQLVLEIVRLIRELDLTQAAAGELLGLPQPKVSQLFQGRTTGFSTDRLIRLLNRLDQDVDIVIHRKPAARRRARLQVIGSAVSGGRGRKIAGQAK